MSASSDALVMRADREPVGDAAASGSPWVYRRPRLTIEPRPLASLPAGHIRVEMLLVGVCGSDLHSVRSDPATGAILGSVPLDVGLDGRVLGHEGVGRVCAVGDGVRTLTHGDAVVFETLVTCHRCSTCRRGLFNHCPDAKLLGAQVDGVFRTLVDLPAALAHRVTDITRGSEDGWRAAACIEPAACALRATRNLEVRPAERVVIFGAGPIGLFAAMICRGVLGASVDLVEPLAARRALARPWADRVMAVDEFHADGATFDVVIEASGVLQNIDRVLPRVGPGGRVGLLARSGQSLTLRHVDHLITNGIALVGSRGHLGGAVEDVLQLYRSKRLPLHRSVTGVVTGLRGLQSELESAEPLEQRHTKLLARLAPTD